MLVFFGGAYLLNRSANSSASDNIPVTDNTAQITIQIDQTDNSIISYQSSFTPGVNLETVMQNLVSSGNSDFAYEIQSASYGDYVTSLNGTKADSTKEFWELLVNGQESMVGISAYMPKNNDVISFALTSF